MRKFVLCPMFTRRGCAVIGFTSTYTPGKAIIPNVLGVDLNCGVEARNYGKIKVDENFFKNLDETINEEVPSGRNVHDRVLIDFNLNKLKCARYILKRNKDVYRLNKHTMHLVRLLSMEKEAFETGHIKTYRDGEEHELLMKIRNGYFYENGLFKDEFYDLVKELRKEFKEAEKKARFQIDRI